jgi:hypothetical protein
MRRKRNLTTNKITKHKARLNLHGGKQVFGMNYFETYAPVVTWFAIRLVIVMGIIFNWALHQVDFVMAFPKLQLRWISIWNFLKAFRLRLELQGPRAQTSQEHFWSEASWKGVELISCGQAYLIGLHCFINQ